MKKIYFDTTLENWLLQVAGKREGHIMDSMQYSKSTFRTNLIVESSDTVRSSNAASSAAVNHRRKPSSGSGWFPYVEIIGVQIGDDSII